VTTRSRRATMLVPERTQETACPRRLPLLGNPLRGRGVTAPPPANHDGMLAMGNDLVHGAA
jgi:hypothetical protein